MQPEKQNFFTKTLNFLSKPETDNDNKKVGTRFAKAVGKIWLGVHSLFLTPIIAASWPIWAGIGGVVALGGLATAAAGKYITKDPKTTLTGLKIAGVGAAIAAGPITTATIGVGCMVGASKDMYIAGKGVFNNCHGEPPLSSSTTPQNTQLSPSQGVGLNGPQQHLQYPPGYQQTYPPTRYPPQYSQYPGGYQPPQQGFYAQGYTTNRQSFNAQIYPPATGYGHLGIRYMGDASNSLSSPGFTPGGTYPPPKGRG